MQFSKKVAMADLFVMSLGSLNDLIMIHTKVDESWIQ
jgi:hypothetical protein